MRQRKRLAPVKRKKKSSLNGLKATKMTRFCTLNGLKLWLVLMVASVFAFAVPYQAKKSTSPPRSATTAQTAAAKAAGQVWVNLSTKVYHNSNSEFYGATKAGKFMSEKDAIAAGYRKAKN